MKIEEARGIVAAAWCDGRNSKTEMDVNLAESFAEILVEQVNRFEDDIEIAWGIIANAGGGDWGKESEGWQEAAVRWRDDVWNKIAAGVYSRRAEINPEEVEQ